MSLDLSALSPIPLPIAGTLALIAVKVGRAAALFRLFGLPTQVALQSALLLGPGGEFAFIVIGLAMAYAIVTPDSGSFVQAVTSLSMA